MKVAVELCIRNTNDELFKKVWHWLVKNTGPIEFRNVTAINCYIRFKHAEDAVAFKLRWGDIVIQG